MNSVSTRDEFRFGEAGAQMRALVVVIKIMYFHVISFLYAGGVPPLGMIAQKLWVM
jgi:hypothetical protein